MTRRHLLQTAAVAAALPASCGKKHLPPPPYATLADMGSMLRSGQTSPLLLVEHCLERIAQIDKSGPRVNAILELNPAARPLADSTSPGPLHGLPILLLPDLRILELRRREPRRLERFRLMLEPAAELAAYQG